MKKDRSGFVFKLALFAISLIGIALVVLIVMFYRAKTQTNLVYSPPPERVGKITTSDIDSYLEKMEHYKDREVETLEKDEIEEEDDANLIARHTEIGENSIIKTIDSIVESSSAK